MKANKAFLGVDIGTSKVAAVVYDIESKTILDAAAEATRADRETQIPGAREQDTAKLLNVVDSVVRKLKESARKAVKGIGATGQMHGVALCAEKDSFAPLITWQDRRASADESLAALSRKAGESLSDGYGLTTLGWLASKGALSQFPWKSASTMQDLLVATLCDHEKPLCDPCDAASWGLFDPLGCEWKKDAIKKLGAPFELLPELRRSGALAGRLCAARAEELGLPAGIPVAVATGDNQASILATSGNPAEEIYLTVGTGAQLSVALDAEQARNALKTATPGELEIRPFFDGRFLAVAAPLCGGASFAWMARFVRGLMDDFGIEPPCEKDVYKKLDELAMRSVSKGLRFNPSFIGERRDPTLKASIEGIGLDNFDAGAMTSALAEGTLRNMKSMMPAWAFEGRTKIVASGNAMRKLSIMKVQARRVFGLPLHVAEIFEEAACGAAVLASRLDAID